MENLGFAGSVPEDNNKIDEGKDQLNDHLPLETTTTGQDDQQQPRTNKKMERKTTKEALISSREQKRVECVKKCRRVAEELTKNTAIKEMNYLLEDKEFTSALYFLFDQDSTGALDIKDWLEMLYVNTKGPKFEHVSQERRHDMVNMIENAAYIICGDNPISQEDFRKIINSRGIRENLFRLADADGNGDLNVEEVIDFLVVLSKPRHSDDFSPERIRQLEEIFKQNLPPNKNFLTLTEFKNIMPSKNAFFVERVFKIFDIDGDGTITLAEFLDKMYQYAGSQSDADKVLFLFKVYDIDGDGMLQVEELQCIMAEALRENGLRLPASDVQDLSFALYEEALGDEEDTGEISIDQLKEALAKHEGVLENLTISLSKWIVPKKPQPKASLWQKMKKSYMDKFSYSRLKSQWQLYTFLLFIVIINLILWITRAAYFKDFANLDGSKPNPFYMLSRANGRTLLFNSTMLLVLVLRYTITKLRDLGLSAVLPLDHNIYIHKFIGTIVFVQAWWHTIMHLINFGVNVQPDPVKFVQINTDYWPKLAEPAADTLDQEEVKHLPNWMNLGYRHPPGCIISFEAADCPHLDSQNGIIACEVCPNATHWNWGDWIFTANPGVFGLIPGCANPTGIALIVILTVMVLCSMPIVRRSGYFQVFYFTHLLYWAYMILLILHAPEFWKWVIAPLVIFILEKLYRGLATLLGYGKSYITQATVLASRVTALQIKRPDGFKYSPGDWVFVRIPKIAMYEWHPFTISSAPENGEHVTLHIRGVGQWTNRLFDYVEAKKKQEGIESRRTSTKTPRNKRKSDLENEENKAVRIVINNEEKAKVDERPLEIHLDGPFGAPASNIFRAEHAVLVATGIGVTPFSSILQSIMFRYRSAKRECPRCQLRWLTDLGQAMQSLRKVDFFWINRDQKSFEWFLKLLSEMEAEQQEEETSDYTNTKGRFLDIHLYFTQALQRNDMRAVGMHLAMDLLHRKSGGKDLLTGLKSKTNAGRPNWDKIFQKLQDEHKGKVTVFYCGNQALARILRSKCEEYGFNFRKEVF